MTRFMMTIDTEFSMGGYFQDPANLKPVDAERNIHCVVDGREYGIGFIMSTLEKYGFRGVFFLETESRYYFGEAIHKDIIAEIVQRGHEIQLHTHPNFRTFIDGVDRPKRQSDKMSEYSRAEQSAIIKGAKTFLEASGSGPISAFRAGGFFANADTLLACAENGIRYSSNYNLAFPNFSLADTLPIKTGPFRISPDIIELPVTAFREKLGRKPWNALQICAASEREMRAVSECYAESGNPLLVYLTHGQEFVTAKDLQFRQVAPNRLHMQRLENICRWYSERGARFKNVTFADLQPAPLELDWEGPAYISPAHAVVRRYFQNKFP